jgi:flagellar biosynthesis protein FliR
VFALALARLFGLCLTAPAVAVPELDWRFRLGLGALLGASIVPIVTPMIVLPTGWPGIAQALLLELVTGGMLGWSAALILAGAQLAGELISAQMGLATAMLLDSETSEEPAPLGRLYVWIALVVFLALNGPFVLLRVLVESYDAIPAGQLLIADGAVTLVFGQVGRALELALQAAAPAALALTLANIVLCWLNRAAQSLPLITLALPLRSLLGIVLVLLSLATLAVALSGAWTAYLWGR